MNCKYLVFGLIFFLVFSCKDDYEKANENIKGVWALESMQYQDSTGVLKIVSNLDVTITFSNNRESISENDSGCQIIGADTLFFDYYVSLDACCFYYEEWNYSTMPMDVLSSQCFTYTQIDKNTFELYAENEYDYVKKEKISNVSYLYTKLSK